MTEEKGGPLRRAAHKAACRQRFSGILRDACDSVMKNAPGALDYICAVHPYMTGKVVVRHRDRRQTKSGPSTTLSTTAELPSRTRLESHHTAPLRTDQ